MKHLKNFTGMKAAIGTAVLTLGFAVFAGAPAAKADGCQNRLMRADHRLHKAIEHHGYESREANHWRHELREARAYCWEHGHRWWDVEGNRWHSERDWDDHDHDHR